MPQTPAIRNTTIDDKLNETRRNPATKRGNARRSRLSNSARRRPAWRPLIIISISIIIDAVVIAIIIIIIPKSYCCYYHCYYHYYYYQLYYYYYQLLGSSRGGHSEDEGAPKARSLAKGPRATSAATDVGAERGGEVRNMYVSKPTVYMFPICPSICINK